MYQFSESSLNLRRSRKDLRGDVSIVKARSALLYICGAIAIWAGIINIGAWVLIEMYNNALFPIAVRTLAVLLMMLYFPITLRIQSGLSWGRISAMCLPLAGLALLSSTYCSLTDEAFILPVLTAMILLMLITIGVQCWGMWGRSGAMRYIPAAALMAVYTTLGIPILPIPLPDGLLVAFAVFPLFTLYVVLDWLSIPRNGASHRI